MVRTIYMTVDYLGCAYESEDGDAIHRIAAANLKGAVEAVLTARNDHGKVGNRSQETPMAITITMKTPTDQWEIPCDCLSQATRRVRESENLMEFIAAQGVEVKREYTLDADGIPFVWDFEKGNWA